MYLALTDWWQIEAQHDKEAQADDEHDKHDAHVGQVDPVDQVDQPMALIKQKTLIKQMTQITQMLQMTQMTQRTVMLSVISGPGLINQGRSAAPKLTQNAARTHF